MISFITLSGYWSGFDKKVIERYFNINQIKYVESNPANASETFLYINSEKEPFVVQAKADELILRMNSLNT